MRAILIFIMSSVLFGSVVMIAAGCGGGETSTGGSEAGVTIVASTTQLADFAAEVAGERAEVVGILSANSDPHDYEPKPSDAEAVAEANLLLQSGGDLDVWMDEVVESSGTDAPILTLIDSMDTIDLEEDGAVIDDPHWWQDPANAIVAVEAIRDEMAEIDSGNAAEYEANAKAFIAQLEDLEAQIADCIDQVPADQRKLVTSHDALGYFADRFDVEVVGAAIPALSTQAQASAGETVDLVQLIKDENVEAIFAEAGVSSALEETIAAEAGASDGGELWADTLGPEGSDGETYIEAMATNTKRMVEGFTGGEVTCEIDVGA